VSAIPEAIGQKNAAVSRRGSISAPTYLPI
jgi:hypothetical protein